MEASIAGWVGNGIFVFILGPVFRAVYPNAGVTDIIELSGVLIAILLQAWAIAGAWELAAGGVGIYWRAAIILLALFFLLLLYVYYLAAYVLGSMETVAPTGPPNAVA